MRDDQPDQRFDSLPDDEKQNVVRFLRLTAVLAFGSLVSFVMLLRHCLCVADFRWATVAAWAALTLGILYAGLVRLTRMQLPNGSARQEHHASGDGMSDSN
jgi:hypothetical protein